MEVHESGFVSLHIIKYTHTCNAIRNYKQLYTVWVPQGDVHMTYLFCSNFLLMMVEENNEVTFITHNLYG